MMRTLLAAAWTIAVIATVGGCSFGGSQEPNGLLTRSAAVQRKTFGNQPPAVAQGRRLDAISRPDSSRATRTSGRRPST